ncbi:MAG TPA: GNAT family N-acetyltransferase [Terriglobia bacterium]|jgi:GNAT superfamily N-acetyltransferase|nr:GNAT family N-acetyltransferase [Terriglobia bacterium]
MRSVVIVDHALACRLERTEGTANARFVEARARVAPGSGAQCIEIAGAYAMFDAPQSPCTQTFGLGLFRMPTAVDMDRVEAFFKDRGAPVLHEVSPLADKALLPMLRERGYGPVELSNVLFLPIGDVLSSTPISPSVEHGSLRARVAGPEEKDVWARTMAEGWREFVEFADYMLDLTAVSAAIEGNILFLAELDGQPVAAGALATHQGVALLTGASTIPEWRRRGAQNALLASRLDYAVRAGCDLAMFCAEPGGGSQRNAQRHGFQIAYTRIKWGLS